MRIAWLLGFCTKHLGRGLPCHKSTFIIKLWYVDGDGFVVVGIMDVAVAVYHPIPYPQVERMGAVFGGGIDRAARCCMPRWCWYESRCHTHPLAHVRDRDMFAVVVTADGGRFVVSPKRRQIPAEQMPLRVHGRDEERELIAAAFDDVAYLDLCAIVERSSRCLLEATGCQS
jgi:hypothetical protein